MAARSKDSLPHSFHQETFLSAPPVASDAGAQHDTLREMQPGAQSTRNPSCAGTRVQPYTWAVISGSLPGGLNISSDGGSNGIICCHAWAAACGRDHRLANSQSLSTDLQRGASELPRFGIVAARVQLHEATKALTEQLNDIIKRVG